MFLLANNSIKQSFRSFIVTVSGAFLASSGSAQDWPGLPARLVEKLTIAQ
jgi:hypothetical protein